ncbi:MAG TPA: hypothetical protein VFZ12_05680 [Dehalococcoidia bacterium]|nr:hypothetical protein [Dehalococcoidia bacterium]
MKFLNKWTMSGGLAVAGIIAAFSLLSGSAQAGGDDPGELIRGDLECDKFVSDENADIIQGDTVTFNVVCEVNFPALDEGDPIFIGDISIFDQLPDNFDIEFATCDVEQIVANVEPFFFENGPPFPASINGQAVTCVFNSPIECPEGIGGGTVVAEFGEEPLICLPRVVEMTIEGSFNVVPCGVIKNLAVAEAGGDTEFAEVVIFLECFDVAVTKTAATVTDSTGATVLAGGTIIYTIEVCNVAPGPSLVNNVFFFDQLPLGTQFQSSASPDFDLAFDATSSQILGTTDQLQAGECGTAFITVEVADDAPCGLVLTNTVVAGSATGIISDFPFDATNFVTDDDADASDNIATTTTTVACPGDDKDDDDGGGGGGAGGGGKPSVATGDSLVDGESLAGWQMGLLSLMTVIGMTGAALAYRRTR